MLRRAAAFLILLPLVVTLQWYNGAYTSDFAGHPDEAAHYVTGLMVHDYLASVPWAPPMGFAQNFYDHYPKVAIGHWPPVFYLTQALWTLAFTPARTSVIFFIAVLAALTAAVLFELCRPLFGATSAFLLSAFFLITPIVQAYSAMVMAELLVTLLVVGAAVAYAQYLKTEELRYSVLFGVLASAAVLTKANGLALSLLPPVAIMAAQRTQLVRRFSFWLPAVLVAALCAPWYFWTLDLAREGWSASYSPGWLIGEAAASNARSLFGSIGLVLSALAAIGFLLNVAGRWRLREVNERWAVMTALVVAVWAFHSFVLPVRDPRHLIPAVAALLAFAAAGIVGVVDLVASPRTRKTLAPVLAAAAGLIFIAETFPVQKKPSTGADAIALAIVSRGDLERATALVSSEAFGEGAVIAEIAMRETRPGRRILRASKVLAQSNWDGSSYQPSYTTPGEVSSYLQAIRVRLLIIDNAPPIAEALPHHRLLLDVVKAQRERWRPLDVGESRYQVFEEAGEGVRLKPDATY